MGMVVRRVQPVDPNRRQVLYMKSNESLSKPVAHILHVLRFQLVLKFTGEPVSLKLESPTNGVHPHSDNGFQGHEDHLEQDKRWNSRGSCRNVCWKVERSEEPRGMNKGGKESEDRKDVGLGNNEKLGWVHIIPMAKFMSEDGFYLFSFALLDEGIEDDNMFAPWEAKEVRIAMRAALGTVDLIQMLEREVQLRSKAFDPFSKVAFGERRQLIKEWLNDSRVDEDHQNLEGKQERHQEWDEAVTSPLKDLQKGGKEWSTESKSNQPAFNGIRDKKPRSHLVKPVFFLEDEGLVSGEWNAWDRGDKE